MDVTSEGAFTSPLTSVERSCTFTPCGRRIQAKGLCNSHYWQQRVGRPLTEIATTTEARFWSKVDKTPNCWLWVGGSCNRFKVGGKILSVHHWAYQNANGAIPRGSVLTRKCGTENCVRPDHLELAKETRSEMFWSKVDKTETCWIWAAATAGRDRRYGQFGVGYPKLMLAHRWSYENAHGPIPPGMQVDHSCRVTLCVNPAHLRLATNKQNHENIVAHADSQTGVRGVYRNKRGTYYVQVTHHGKRHCRGNFSTLLEAEQVAIGLRNQLFTHNDGDR